MIIVYVLLLFFLGYFVISILNKANVVLYNSFHGYEVLSNSFVLGIILFIIYMFIYGLLFEYSNIMFIPIVVIDIISIIFFIKDIKDKKIVFEKKELDKKNKVLNIILNVITTIIFILYASYALSSNINSPDEFTLWGRVSKAIFKFKDFKSLNSTLGISYPLSMPLLYSGFYFLVGVVKSNQIRLLSTVLLLCFWFLFVGRAKRKNYNIILTKFLLLVFISLNNIVDNISSTMYVDIIIMYLNSIGFLYLIDYYHDKEDFGKCIMFIIFSAFLCCIKPDGIFLSLILIVVIIIDLFINKIFNKRKIDFKKNAFIVFSLISSVASYFVYKIVYLRLLKNKISYISTFTSDSKELHLDYLNRSIENGAKQLFNNYSTIIFALLIIVLTILLLYKDKKIMNKKKIILLSLCYIFNLLFLYLAFIYQFGGEGVIAPSIIRYMTRVTPLIIEIILIMYNEYKEK